MRDFLTAGAKALAAARRLARAAPGELARRGVLVRHSKPAASTRLGPPVPDPEKIICVGTNYADHCAESGAEPPDRPILFAKFRPSLAGPRDEIVLPAISEEVDYEAELAFVVGRRARHVPLCKALDYVAGYMVLNDVTARDIQRSDGQWVRGKSFETFAPCGPALVTRDEVPDHKALRIGTTIAGEVLQDSSTANLIFDVPYILSFISEVMPLAPGDVVSTGTPPGVGVFRDPPRLLRPGDVCECWVERLGRLANPVVAAKRRT
jgi:2-keto-4-pentenoate hydratase/2-oxohepta-3-ene-1,7-dioic acid hydratase in catechol pathway